MLWKMSIGERFRSPLRPSTLVISIFQVEIKILVSKPSKSINKIRMASLTKIKGPKIAKNMLQD